jgi:hypothetical protein
VGGLALGIQTGILGLAIMIGVMDPPQSKEAKLKLPPGSKSKFREQQQQISDQLAKMNRLNKAEMGKLMEPLMQSLAPDIPVMQPDLVQSFQAMGAMLPTDAFFRNEMAAFTDGLDTDSLPPPDPVSFLGESLNAKRIVLLLDVSSSVKTKIERAGLSMEKLRAEVHRFVDQLGPNHLFGIIQFTRNWQAFQKELLPATEKVRQQARDWINGSFRTTGTSGRNWTRGMPNGPAMSSSNGIEGVLAAAFGMDPEVDEIFLVSDGDFQRTPPGGGGQDVPWAELRRLTKSLQEQSINDTRLRILCFYPPEEAISDLRAWVKENGDGTLRIFAAAQ